MKKIYIKDLNNQGNKFTAVVVVKENDNDLFSQVVEARSKNEFDNNCNNILTIAEQVQKDFSAMKEGEWVAPEEKSKEEKDKSEYYDSILELENKKKEKDLGLITDVEYNTEVEKVKKKKEPLESVKSKK